MLERAQFAPSPTGAQVLIGMDIDVLASAAETDNAAKGRVAGPFNLEDFDCPICQGADLGRAF